MTRPIRRIKITIKYVLISNLKRTAMNTKLTLKLDRAAIEAAKSFARDNQTSVSKLVEAYFKTLARHQGQVSCQKISGVVGELAGILKGKDIETGSKDYTDYLESKYR